MPEPMKSVELDTICPHCGYYADKQAGVNRTVIPKPHDVAICINCGKIAKFTDNLQLIAFDLHTLPFKLQEELAILKTAWRRFEQAKKEQVVIKLKMKQLLTLAQDLKGAKSFLQSTQKYEHDASHRYSIDMARTSWITLLELIEGLEFYAVAPE